VIPFIPLISAGIAGGTQLIGAHMAAGASKEASKTQAQSDQNSLNFLQQQFQELQRQHAPYVAFGQSALGSLSDLLGYPRPPAMAAAPAAPPTAPPMTTGTSATGSGAMATAAQHAAQMASGRPAGAMGGAAASASPQGGGAMPTADAMVTMVAPDGSQRSIPSGMADFYRAKGARVVA
jgi:hypothetical protein